MASSVYFWDFRTSRKYTYEQKIKKLLKNCEVAKFLGSKKLVALKIHFGEKGVTGFIAPLWVKPLVEFVQKTGALPFLTDTNTLYVGERGEAVSHLMQAARHGFDPLLLGAPIIIADGLKSQNEKKVSLAGKHFQEVFLAGDIVEADYLINLAHFKGHELAGFGGALKNLAMGCATRKGKMQQHCGFGPKVEVKKCVGCGECVQVCQSQALTLEDKKVALKKEKCTGCAACFLACKTGALEVNWKVDVKVFLERMAEYVLGVVSQFSAPLLHLNFVKDVTPDCDCVGFSDANLCPDIGILASYDPVALDQAAWDLVNKASYNPFSQYAEKLVKKEDVFQAIHPKTQGKYLLEYAEQIGLGTRSYKLIKI
ncbi:MAG TPA: FeS-binding protein [Desulfonauticus sp.]|jgi:hypothetical protein|nr:MAG: 4Fe-4S ferredoxin iron-sulfur binding domain protein [Desulfonauticus sp. 38_4375]MDK2921326.1 uncharacterized protein [Desulfonauticus sp.]HCO11681.1 FeS-binding protein [Desulfonauticus sp.]